MFLASVALLALAVSPARAWIPGEHREIYAQDGTNLFKNTALGGNSTSKRWLQASGKVRGVNLGSLFVFEPWLAETEWSNMGCSGQNSEFDCVSYLGQTQANSVFQAHWNSWITQADIAQMQSYGLNTIRVPVGYWMMESIVYADSEHFPQGGIGYLEQLCGWASDAGFYIIIDLHGAPGAQVPQNPDTGQVSLPEDFKSGYKLSALALPSIKLGQVTLLGCSRRSSKLSPGDVLLVLRLTKLQYAPTAGFYVDYQYARAEQFLGWLTNLIHTTNAFRNVGMLGIVNEPIQNSATVATMLSSYYPAAYNVSSIFVGFTFISTDKVKAIRNAESALGVTANNYLHVEPMNSLWGSGNPNLYMTNTYFMAYDDHR